MLYKEYDEKTLTRLQQMELEILRDFQYLCKKYDIDYFAGGGTAIGAVRHGGFIPWDDDIDINLLREDYEKFLKYAEIEYADKYKLINAEKSDIYPLMTTRWMKIGTKFKEECFKDLDIDLGVFLDIYCFDNIPDGKFFRMKHGYKAWFLNKLMILKAVSSPVLYFGGMKEKIVRRICKIGHIFLNVFPISNQFLYKKVKKELIKYNKKDTECVAYLFDPTPFTSVISRKDIFPTKEIPFEDGTIKVINHVEKYLTRRFGDYMVLPPEDKRHNHPPYLFDLGEDK